MDADPLLKIAWQIAEIEARALGSRVIEPMHFLLATLKIVDPEFPIQLEKLDIGTDDWKMMCKEAVKIRHYLDLIPAKVSQIRRRIRHRLSRGATPPLSVRVKIHRSRKSCAAFFDAHTQACDEMVTLLQLTRSMFELGFLDVSDMRWRGVTQTRMK